jgi:hypothetical protein
MSRQVEKEKRELMFMLRGLVKTRVVGIFPDGKLEYRIHYQLASGRPDTALMGAVGMEGMMKVATKQAGIPSDKMSHANMGDDHVFMIEKGYIGMIERIIQVYRKFGMELNVEGRLASDLECIQFCQHRIVAVDGVYRMVRDWRKVIGKVRTGYRWHATETEFDVYAATVGVCEGILNAGVPIISTFAEYLRQFGQPNDEVRKSHWHYKQLSFSDYRFVPISWATRVSFERAFGITPSEQARLEELISGQPRTWSSKSAHQKPQVYSDVPQFNHGF